MNFKKVFLLIGLGMGTGVPLKAQVDNDAHVETVIESVIESVGEDHDFTEILERLNFYRKNPINLNDTSPEQLQELMFLSPLHISQLISHRNENGRFLELYELQSIDAFDAETIQRLLPFITIRDLNPLGNLPFKDLLRKGNHDLMFTFGQIMEKQEGYRRPEQKSGSHYLGSPQRLLGRYRYHFADNLSASLTFEKDAGEAFFSANQRGFDFYSGNISYKSKGTIRKAILGDYSLQFGQGLTLWTGLGFGKGASIAGVAKNEVGLKPYSSTNEALFLRGGAVTLKLSKIEFTPFVSYKPVDAGMVENEDTRETEIGSLAQSGLHRTAGELQKKNSSNQLLIGTNIQYSARSLRAGLVGYHTSFDKSFEKETATYSTFDFTGRKLYNLGAYYNYNWRNIYFFGEAAHSLDHGFAFLNGLMASLTPSVTLVSLQRDYYKDYYSLFNQVIAEGSSAINEKGFYSGLVISPNRKYELSLYADFFRFPWLRYRVDAPSKGYEILSQLSYSPSKRFKTVLRYKFENKEQNDDLENEINFLDQFKKQNYRLELSYKINDNFHLRNRAEVVSWQKGLGDKEMGFLLFQDVIYNPLQSKVSGNFRLALFDTESFNARIYAYENDVLYGFSAPAYQHKGLRFYLNGRYRFSRRFDGWLRYAITTYTDLEEIGSGLDKIEGSRKSDLKIQIRYQF